MTTKKYLESFSGDNGLLEQLKDCPDFETLYERARKNGVEDTAEDFFKAIQEKLRDDALVAEEEIKEAAGGALDEDSRKVNSIKKLYNGIDGVPFRTGPVSGDDRTEDAIKVTPEDLLKG